MWGPSRFDCPRVQAPALAGVLLGSGDGALPVMMYGHAHQDGRSLAQLRRSLGYLAGASSGVPLRGIQGLGSGSTILGGFNSRIHFEL